MVMPKLKLVKGKTIDESASAENGTALFSYVNHGNI